MYFSEYLDHLADSGSALEALGQPNRGVRNAALHQIAMAVIWSP
jgi:hypothetical protein